MKDLQQTWAFFAQHNLSSEPGPIEPDSIMLSPQQALGIRCMLFLLLCYLEFLKLLALSGKMEVESRPFLIALRHAVEYLATWLPS